MRHGTYVKDLDEYSDIGTHWIALYVLSNNVDCFVSFGVERIPKENITFIDIFTIVTNIFRIQADDSVMGEYFYIGFINSMLKNKNLNDFTNLFSRKKFLKNDVIVLSYFKNG